MKKTVEVLEIPLPEHVPLGYTGIPIPMIVEFPNVSNALEMGKEFARYVYSNTPSTFFKGLREELNKLNKL